MPLDVHARISSEPLSVDAALARVRTAEVGGIGVFIGVVRNHDGGRSVTALEYSSHPTAEAALADCARDVAANHEVRAIAVEHRVGALAIGDPAVVVAVGAAHRAAALECCRELIDRLKVEVPIWKRQSFVDGDVEWVGA